MPEPLEKQDLVLISDVDEVPRRSAIAHLRDAPPTDDIIALEMTSFIYQLNLRARGDIYAARAVRGSVFELLTPHEIRRTAVRATIPDAGWHFTYLAPRNETVERIQTKVASFAHDELDSADVLDGGGSSGWSRRACSSCPAGSSPSKLFRSMTPFPEPSARTQNVGSNSSSLRTGGPCSTTCGISLRVSDMGR